MTRFAALLVAASVLAVSLPAAADGIPREKRPTRTEAAKQKRAAEDSAVIEKTVVVEERPAAPPVVAAPAPPPQAAALFVWMPGHWTWNGPMSTHVWVPGMYILPPSSEEQQTLALWRLGKWIGFGRSD